MDIQIRMASEDTTSPRLFCKKNGMKLFSGWFVKCFWRGVKRFSNFWSTVLEFLFSFHSPKETKGEFIIVKRQWHEKVEKSVTARWIILSTRKHAHIKTTRVKPKKKTLVVPLRVKTYVYILSIFVDPIRGSITTSLALFFIPNTVIRVWLFAAITNILYF